MSGEVIDQLIVKFLTNSATSNELDMLNHWISTPGNEAYFYSFVETHFAISSKMNIPDTEKVKKEFLANIRKEKRREKLKNCYQVLKYAAIVLVAIGGAFWVSQKQELSSVTTIPDHQEPLKNQVTLQLGNGSVIGISPNKMIKTRNGDVLAQSDSTKLNYPKNKGVRSLFYNKLMVPYGKKYNVVLADGSFVRLNSGSSLLYPVDFLVDTPRKVYLQGEAFFQVTHDVDRPFYVGVEGVDVKVYGTDFNVKNYSEEPTIEVVLVDGSVSLIADHQQSELLLTPSEMGTVDKTEKTTSKRIVDTDLYTSWTNGNMVFRDEAFENIILDLERSYNVLIVNNNQALAQTHFNAIIETEKETIDQVLKYFSKIFPMKYRIDGSKIIIN